MTKKILSAMMAFTMLFATSCQNDSELFGTSTDGAAEVTFSISTPELATRAFSDGLSAKDLVYAVYDARNVLLSDLSGIGTFKDDLTTTVNLTLTTGNTYTVLFWADNENAPYTFDETTQTVTVDYDAATMCNDENRDAFFAKHTFTVNGKQTETVKLYRPFSQLNIGTSDYAASEIAGYKPTMSAVKVKNVYTTLNLLTGEVDGSTEVYYDYTEIPFDQEFPVEVAEGENKYEYLAMNYLLVAADKELVEVEFSYMDPNENDTEKNKTRIIGSVPVQRNFRTNIYGKLLTSDVDINVEIVPAYNEPDELFPDSDRDALYLAAAVGGEVTLNSNVTLTRPLIFRHSAKINLNGYTITGGKSFAELEKPTGNLVSAFAIDNKAEVTVVGDGGKIIGAGYGINVYNGTLNIKDATVEGYSTSIQVNIGTLNIESGYYYITSAGRVINCIDGPYDNGLATVNITGGTYKEFDPANNESEGPNTNFCAPGYTTVKDGDNYIVVKGATVSNVEEFYAVAADENIEYMFIIADLDFGTSTALVTTDKVIIGNGHSIKAGGTTSSKNYGLGVSGAKVTINDLVMNGGGGIYSTSGADVVVNNVALKPNYSASGRHMFYVSNATLTVKGGTFEVGRTGCKYFSMENNAKAYVTGGTFEDMMANEPPVNLKTGATLEISGGKFRVSVANYKFDPTAWVPAGYKAERVGNYMEVSAE